MRLPRAVVSLVTFLAAMATTASEARTRPVTRGCTTTSLVSVGPRLEGVSDSGVFARFGNRLQQVSYDPIPALNSAQPGDPIQLCLISRPKNCPVNDVRGARYAATNLRTGARWTAYDSSHRCGGA